MKRGSVWMCPTCSIAKQRPYIVNSAPYRADLNDSINQGNNHLEGQRHLRCSERIGSSLFSLENMDFFFGSCIDEPIPDWTTITPQQALRNYFKKCGGDPDKAIADLASPPVVTRSTLVVKRNITSSPYASTRLNDEANYCKLLCCWDDPLKSQKCLRKNCPYLHVSDIAEQQPTALVRTFSSSCHVLF